LNNLFQIHLYNLQFPHISKTVPASHRIAIDGMKIENGAEYMQLRKILLFGVALVTLIVKVQGGQEKKAHLSSNQDLLRNGD